jgi:hypothetical protein
LTSHDAYSTLKGMFVSDDGLIVLVNALPRHKVDAAKDNFTCAGTLS